MANTKSLAPRQIRYSPSLVKIPTVSSAVPEHKKKLEARRAQIVTAQRATEAYVVKVPRTQRQLRVGKVRKAPLAQMVKVKRERLARRKAKEQARGKVRVEFGKQAKLEKEFAPKYQAYQAYQAKITKLRSWNLAIKFYRKGIPWKFVGGQEGRYLRKLYKTSGGYVPQI